MKVRGRERVISSLSSPPPFFLLFFCFLLFSAFYVYELTVSVVLCVNIIMSLPSLARFVYFPPSSCAFLAFRFYFYYLFVGMVDDEERFRDLRLRNNAWREQGRNAACVQRSPVRRSREWTECMYWHDELWRARPLLHRAGHRGRRWLPPRNQGEERHED